MTHFILSLFCALALESFLSHDQNFSRFEDFKKNLFWLLATGFVLPFIMTHISFYLAHQLPTPAFITAVQRYFTSHQWIQVILGFLILDFSRYAIHYFFHRVPFLWTFHKVHHSIDKLTVLSSFRISSIEFILNVTILTLVTRLFNFNFSALFIITFINSVACLIQHAHIPSSIFESKIETLFITPSNHRLHHSKYCRLKFGQNFGFLLNIWDRLFKTYLKPNQDFSDEIGIDDKYFPKSHWKQWLYPFLK